MTRQRLILFLTTLACSLAAGAAIAQSRDASRAGAAGEDPAAFQWRAIPPGEFKMGCVEGDSACFNNEMPARDVTITRRIEMLATEVTLAQWRGASKVDLPTQPAWNTNPRQPVVSVTRAQAAEFCTAIGGRLPTEAEWEYAARGGGLTIYPWGNTVGREHANYGTDTCCKGHVEGGDQWMQTAPVGSFKPNGFALYDMAGNVYEWVSDWYDAGLYKQGPAKDPTGPQTGERWLVRGGAWDGTPGDMRVSNRNYLVPRLPHYPDVGFRCVRDVK